MPPYADQGFSFKTNRTNLIGLEFLDKLTAFNCLDEECECRLFLSFSISTQKLKKKK